MAWLYSTPMFYYLRNGFSRMMWDVRIDKRCLKNKMKLNNFLKVDQKKKIKTKVKK